MNTRARSTRKAKDAASSFVKRVTSGRNANSPTPEKNVPDTKSKQYQVKGKETHRARTTGSSSGKSKSPGRESGVRKRGIADSNEAHDEKCTDTAKGSGNKDAKIKVPTNEQESFDIREDPTESGNEEEEGASTVTIVPRFGPTSKENVTEPEVIYSQESGGRRRRDSSPQVVLSPTTKYITGKSGGKSQVFKLSLAPGSEGQLIQAGGTVKLGSTLLKITPKPSLQSGSRKDGETSQNQGEKMEDTDQEEYVSSLDTSIDEFEILDESIEDEEDDDVSYPSGQQDAFFSAFGLVKKSELPKDGKVNKLHRLAGGKLRRVLKPNFAPGMIYKDGKIVMEDATEGSPRSKAKLLTKSSFSQKLEFGDVIEVSPTSSPKPKKREWLKPPPRRSRSPIHDESDTPETTPTKSGKNTSKIKSSKISEGKLKKHSSFPRETVSKKLSMAKTKSSNDIDLNILPFRRSSRQRDSKRKEWKHLLRACPDEFEEDPKWEAEIDQRRHRSQTRMAKKLEREKSGTQEKEHSHSDTSSGESDGEKTVRKEKKSASTAKAKVRRAQRKEVEKQIKEADSSKMYADIYDEIVLKRGSFNRIRKQADWGLAKQMLDEEQRKAKQRRMAAVKLLDNVEKGKSKVVTKGMGVYEGVSWEMSHIEESSSPVKNQTAVETVMEEIISPDGHVIKVKVEKDADEEEEDVQHKPKKKKRKSKEKETERSRDSGAEETVGGKILLSPKFVKIPAQPSSSARLDESAMTSPTSSAPSRNAPMIVILGPDGRPLPPTRSSYLCDKIRSTLEEVVQKPEMLRKGRVLELKVPKHKILPPVIKQSMDGNEMEQEETSPAHQSFLPIVSVKTDFQRELECQVPHMCNICWVNDHMYCKNMKRLERDLPYTGGCMHYVPCRHYMHLQDHKLVNKARFLSVRKWQAMLAEKYFDNDDTYRNDKFDDCDEYETEDLALVEDEDGNFIAVNADGVRVGDECNIQFETETISDAKEATGATSPQPYISSSQDSGYHSELPDSQQTAAGDTSMESIETDDILANSLEEETPTATLDADRDAKNDTEMTNVMPTIMVTSPVRDTTFVTAPKRPAVVKISHQVPTTSDEPKKIREESELMCDETITDSDTETDLDLTPPKGTEILHIQIRARAAQIARSLIFDGMTIDAARSLCNQEEKEQESDSETIFVEPYGAEITLGDPEESEDEKFVTSLLYPEKCPTHYEFVHEDNTGHSEIEETSEFIDIRGRKHRVIKVHIAKLDEETRDELMKSLSSGGKKADSRSLLNHPSQTPEYKTTKKRKRTGSSDSNESDESESKKRPSPSGSKKGLMQKTDVHQFSLKTHKAMRGPLTASSSHTTKSPAKANTRGEEEKVKGKPKERPLSMQPIKINSTEAELPQELQDQSTSGEDGSQVLTFTTKEIREKKPELLAYIKRAGLAPVIAEKLKAEKASIERMVKDAEAQLAKLQDQLGEQKLLHKALSGEVKTVKEELQELQLMVVEDEAQAAKFRIKKSYLENRRRFLEKRRDNCAQSVNHLIKFYSEGKLPEGDSETEASESETVDADKSSSTEQAELSTTQDLDESESENVPVESQQQQETLISDQGQQTPPSNVPRPIQQSVAVQHAVASAKDARPKLTHIPSPPHVQRVTKPQVLSASLRQGLVSQTMQVPLQQAVEGNVGAQQQFLQIVGSDGKTQLVQIVGNSANQQVFELVTGPGQQPVLKPVSVQKQQQHNVSQQENTIHSTLPQEEEVIQYTSGTHQGHLVISQDQAHEQIIITDGSHHQQVVQEHVVVTEGSQEQVIYSDVLHDQLVLSDPQSEQIIVTEGVQEQVVVSGYPQEQVVEEVVMEEVPSHVAHREIVVSSSPRVTRPTLQSLLHKQPAIRPKPTISVLKPQLHQQIVGGVPIMVMTQASASPSSSQPQTIYTIPSSSQTAVVTANQQAPSSAVVVTSVPGAGQVIQSDNIIETAFAAATQGESEAEMVESGRNSRVSVQVCKQPQAIVQQQPQQQVVLAQGQSGEMMNIDDIDVQPLQASQEDIMRTMESIASELLGVSSIDLAP